ncbi:hypothetical protein KCP76_26460 (plasmid) [Salmonella enterica subsp. enterica serovar Weltevreden]|nr:hypothetical protein KCP76_26460 [Salmonella enterica subsp. enterica serovar Weltevreden]QUI99502.1 hypothetical protein KCP74_25875 [Salmonella enterica subsp. enterica]QUJ01270.1 hypothetical protein KCP73_27200 [Salmonella enterica subsp. enterica]
MRLICGKHLKFRNRKDSLTTKAAYFLGLTGPAISIITSRSTASHPLLKRVEIYKVSHDMALAGGVSLTMPEEIGYTIPKVIMSRDGHRRPFDQSASGTIPASGVAVVFVETPSAIQTTMKLALSPAASYHDGDRKNKLSYTAPSLIGQSECIINAYEMAGNQLM